MYFYFIHSFIHSLDNVYNDDMKDGGIAICVCVCVCVQCFQCSQSHFQGPLCEHNNNCSILYISLSSSFLLWRASLICCLCLVLECKPHCTSFCQLIQTILFFCFLFDRHTYIYTNIYMYVEIVYVKRKGDVEVYKDIVVFV